MNKEHLESKIWYRTLKVLFFATFIFIQLLSLYVTFSTTSSTREFVKCIDGKEFENPYYGLEFYKFSNEADLTRRCENSNTVFTPLTKEQYQKAIDAGFSPDQIIAFEKRRKAETTSTFNPLDYGATPVDFVPDKLPYSKYEKAQYAPATRAAFLLGSIVIVSFAFWFVARIFFYIILGEKLFSLKKRNNNQN